MVFIANILPWKERPENPSTTRSCRQFHLKVLRRVRRKREHFFFNVEWEPSNGAIVRAAEAEQEDRINGNFPYEDPSIPGISDFYAGKDILITGGTGFVGKVLIEKILRSLPEGGRIFLLLRGRKGLTAQQRVHAMLGLPVSLLVPQQRCRSNNHISVC